MNPGHENGARESVGAGTTLIDRGTVFIPTFSGKLFWPLEPRLEELEIADIAHHLAMTCRWRGAVLEFLSVAQHSWHVAKALRAEPLETQLWGLLHDADEFCLCDLSSPLKSDVGFGAGFRAASNRVLKVVAERYGLAWPMPDVVGEADRMVAAAEARMFLRRAPSWAVQDQRYQEEIFPWSPEQAKNAFMAKFDVLMHALGRS